MLIFTGLKDLLENYISLEKVWFIQHSWSLDMWMNVIAQRTPTRQTKMKVSQIKNRTSSHQEKKPRWMPKWRWVQKIAVFKLCPAKFCVHISGTKLTFFLQGPDGLLKQNLGAQPVFISINLICNCCCPVLKKIISIALRKERNLFELVMV